MMKSYTLLLFIVALLGPGCATQSQFLDNNQGSAIQTAVSRAQFEMNCPQATGTVLSRDVIQPTYQGPWVSGINRAE